MVRTQEEDELPTASGPDLAGVSTERGLDTGIPWARMRLRKIKIRSIDPVKVSQVRLVEDSKSGGCLWGAETISALDIFP